MLFFSNFFNFSSQSTKRLEKQAHDILDLPNGHKAYRLPKDLVIIDSSNKIIQRTKDTLPTNHARATTELVKRLNLDKPKVYKKSDVWTCGFRDNEARWVWYRNSEPAITANYKDVFKDENLEDKVFFYSARFGTSIIAKIKEEGLHKTARQINALVLEKPFITVTCSHCLNQENYTIDDLVDQHKKPNYESEFIICQNCDKLVKL